MAWESVRQDITVPEPKVQYKSGTRIEQYRLSEDALFMPREKYIPLDAIEKIQIRKNLMNSGHCCGVGIPVSNLIVFCGTERPVKIMLEKDKNARKLAGQLLEKRGGIVWEEYISPPII